MFRLRLCFAIVLAAGFVNIAPASAAGAGVTINPAWLSLRLAAGNDPALLYNLPRWLAHGPRRVVKRMFASPWVTSQATLEIVLHAFNGIDGEFPHRLIRDANGALYGTTSFGGSGSCFDGGCGTVFKLTPPARVPGAWTRTTLYNFTGGAAGFSGGADGAFPDGALIADANGALYGTTSGGGDASSPCGGCGIVFKLTPPAPGHRAWTESILHTFAGADGAGPYGALTVFGGALFATTESGGAADSGAIVELTPPRTGSKTKTWNEQVVHSFGASGDGAGPNGDLLADHGELYATTSAGGTHNDGTVVKLTPPSNAGKGWTEIVVHSFDGSDGRDPNLELLADAAGNIYGTAYIGGNSSCTDGCGVAFELKRPANGGLAWTDQVLYRFNESTGVYPTSGLIADSLGSLYGVADAGGPRGNGVVYKLTHTGKTTWSQTILRAFAGGATGTAPYDNLLGDSHGNLYGVAGGGDDSSSCEDYCGIVYELAK